MLSSIGFQNEGIEYFIENELPFLRKFDTAIIVNVCENKEENYIEMCKILNTLPIDGVELSVARTNIENRGLPFASSYEGVKEITTNVRKVLNKPLIIKLTPNVSNIAKIAKGAEDAGADGVSLINTIQGMKIDIERRKPVLATNIGGLSGPAIRPIAVRMVYEVSKNLKIPVLGMGGIANYEDAIEFMLAGATAISIGSANFSNPYTSIEIIKEIENYMKKHNIENINEIIGKVVFN